MERKTAAGLALLAILALPKPAEGNDVSFTPYLGVGYRTLAVGEDMEDYFKRNVEDRFSAAMPGIEDQVVPGRQLLYLEAGLLVDPAWEVPLQFRAAFDFSSSAILPEQSTLEHYDANLQLGENVTLPLGDTTTEWTQELNHYLAVRAGLEYLPREWGERVTISPVVGITGGVSLVNAESRMRIEMLQKEIIERLGGREAINAIEIYEVIDSVVSSTGVGFPVEFYGGLDFGFGDWHLRPEASYRMEIFPRLDVGQRSDSDGQIATDQEFVRYNMSGLDITVIFGREF